MGDPIGIPLLPGSLNLSKKEFEEFRDIVAETKESELQQSLAQQRNGRAPSSAHGKKKSGSDQGRKDAAFVSLNGLVDKEPEVDNQRGGCCKFCCPGRPKNLVAMNRTKSAIAAIMAWDTKHCRTIEDFVGLMTMVTKNAEETVQGLQSILPKLSYIEDPDPEVGKLSIAGSYLWLITYGMQYIAISQTAQESPATVNLERDPDEIQFHANPRINTRIMETHEAYEEIGGIVQEWVPLSLDFLQRTNDLRQNGAEVVNILHNRFRFKKNPFKDSPVVKPQELHPKNARVVPDLLEQVTSNRVGRKPSMGTSDRGILNQSLRVQWSPVVVLVQATPVGRWEVFSSLETPEKVELIAMFIQEPLRLLNSCVKTFKRSVTPSDVVEQPNSERSSSILEVTCGMLHFTSSNRFRKLKLSPVEVESLGLTVEKFWVTVDSLYETALQVSKLVNETRDIVRSCYIYSDNFYNWNLKNFDLFEHPTQSLEQEERMKKFVTEVVGKNNVVDVAKFYSIADFTTSHYQYVLQRNPVSSHGVALKLESWDDFKNEPWGLVDDTVDHRKTKAPSARSKSRYFAVTYRASV